jgi:DNA-binding NtrC family response regulator
VRRTLELLYGENMMSSTVVIAQNDPDIAQGLANDLHAHFARVAVAESAMELRTLLLRHEARVAVLDLEVVNLEEVRQLARTFCNLTIVCTHRSPDERMWIAALNAGAVEFCHPQDIRSIMRASSTSAARHLAIAA